jgi:Carboxypeptidase regulatory-like domain/TonB dependent receptor
MSKLRSRSPLLLLAAALAIGTTVPSAEGQTFASTAAFSGSISDPSGARVPNATVMVTSPDKGITRTFKTDAAGNFAFALLPAAAYTLTVEASGFKTFRQQGINLEVGQSASQNITLTIGSAEQIEVTAAAFLLQTENANVGAEVSTKQVTELPLNLRNVFNFVQLNSSVNNNAQQQILQGGGEQGTADQDVSFFTFGGGYFGTTAFLLDGAWDTGNDWGGVEYVPSPDNVQEFKVQQNSFTAQYGWSTGNVINVVTKSGTSGLHGDVYDYLRNGVLDANNYFNNLFDQKRPNVHRNQFGVAVGGPVYIPGVYKQHDKTFFFFNYEGHRENNPTSTGGTVPTTAFRNGDFSALLGAQIGTDDLCRPILAGQLYDPFTTQQVTANCGPNAGQLVFIRNPIPGNNIANSTNGINPVGQKLIGYYPQPLNGNLTNNWNATATAATNSDEYSVRLDHNFSDKTRLYGRFSDKHEFKELTPPFYGTSDPAGPGQINPNNRWNVTLGVSQVFTPTFLMSFNVGVVRWVEGNDMQSKGFRPSSLGLPTFVDPYSPQFPVVNVSPNSEGLGPQQGGGQGTLPHNVGSSSIDFTKIKGPHSLSFGYMAVAMDENGGRVASTTFNFDPGFTSGPDPTNPLTGNSTGFASLLLGTPSGGGTGIPISEVTRTRYHGVYLQDDWKATRKLTLNLGLRWEIQRPVRERYNRQAYFDYNAVNPISAAVGQSFHGELKYNNSSNRDLWYTDYKNFAPRFGFAYQLMPKLVMRGGYGMFYPSSYRSYGPAPGFTSGTPFISSTNGGLNPNQTLSNAFSGGLIPVTGSALDGLTNVGFNTTVVSPNRKATYVQPIVSG